MFDLITERYLKGEKVGHLEAEYNLWHGQLGKEIIKRIGKEEYDRLNKERRSHPNPPILTVKHIDQCKEELAAGRVTFYWCPYCGDEGIEGQRCTKCIRGVYIKQVRDVVYPD